MFQAVLAFVFLAVTALPAQVAAQADRAMPTSAGSATANSPAVAQQSDDLAWLSTEERALLARNIFDQRWAASSRCTLIVAGKK